MGDLTAVLVFPAMLAFGISGAPLWDQWFFLAEISVSCPIKFLIHYFKNSGSKYQQ